MVQWKMKPGPGQGNVKIGQYSGLRKLRRAVRRGMVPSERLFIIEEAEKKALRRK